MHSDPSPTGDGELATITVRYENKYQRFVIPSKSCTLRTMVLCEFGLRSSQVESASFSISFGEERVILPIEIELLKADNSYDLQVYFSENIQSGQIIENVVARNLEVPHNRYVEGDEKGSNLPTVIAAYDYSPTSSNELTIKTGDSIKVTQKYNNLWWMGFTENGSQGFFPTNYVKIDGHEQLLSDELGVDPNKQIQEVDLQDDEYFDGYANLQIHWEMLRDSSRSLSYKKGIMELAPLIKDKIVLDIGAGSGVLSVFCAKAGAKHVYAIDASGVLKHAEAVVKLNKLEDRITLIKGKIEDLTLPVDKVDVIVSEWMGTLLICESMIASVLSARSKYLKESGLMIPSYSCLKLCPLDCSDLFEEKIGFWDDVYGIDMSCLKSTALEEFFGRPVFSRIIPEAEVIAEPVVVFSLDMKSATEDCLENILSSFSFEINKSGKLHGFGSWFDVRFGGIGSLELSTSPSSKETHWKQVMFLFEDGPSVDKGAIVSGVMSIERNKYWRRHFEVVIKFDVEGIEKTWQKRFPVWR